MDVEDEPNSYLKYLNDSETPNAYLLENNEVGLFSVEPIFTEMESTDWPQEGFPLLLTNSLITEEECSNSDPISNLTAGTSPCVTGSLNDSVGLHKGIESHIQDQSMEVQDIALIQPNQDESKLSENHLQPIENQLIFDQTEISKEILFNQMELQLTENEGEMLKNCVQFTENELVKQENVDRAEVTETDNTAVVLQSNQNYILVKPSNAENLTRNIQLLNSDGTPIPIDDSLLTSINVPVTQKRWDATQNKPKTVNDLFSTVIANKCKICSFLCEDLEQIKKHISTKHPEFIFTHNGLSNGVSILLSNASKKIQQNIEIKKEFTIYVCSECHGVCTDKNDLKNHMIKAHGLATESESLSSKPNSVDARESKPAKKLSSAFLDDVNVGLVKKQERALQQVKCTVNGCVGRFPTEEYRRKHEKLHIGDTKCMFKCPECDKTFMMWSVARSHMHNDHGVDFGMIVCPMCNIFKSYRTVRVLKHMMIHSEVKPFLCSDCGKCFRQLSQLKNHEALHKLPEDMPSWSKVKKCNKCERFFANSKSLKTHVKTVHENIKPFICNICGHKSSRKSMLELHTRQHTASKPHKCDYCEFRTGDPNSLRRHMMKHLGAVAYQCPYCPYSCIQAGSIKSHFIHKHKDKAGVHFCKYCSYSTINEPFLKAHEKSHEFAIKERNSEVTRTERITVKETDLQTDEETQSCFLNTDSQIEETVDNGGITIPAGLEMPLVS